MPKFGVNDLHCRRTRRIFCTIDKKHGEELVIHLAVECVGARDSFQLQDKFQHQKSFQVSTVVPLIETQLLGSRSRPRHCKMRTVLDAGEQMANFQRNAVEDDDTIAK